MSSPSMSRLQYKSGMGSSSVWETETQRLQREADRFTKELEHERKRLMILEDQYRQAVGELTTKKEKIKEVRPSTREQQKSHGKIKTMENQLEQAKVRYNETTAGNKALRDKINVMRKELRTSQNVTGSLRKEIGETSEKAFGLNDKSLRGQNLAHESRVQVAALQARHEKEKEMFDKQIKILQERLNEKDKVGDLDHRTTGNLHKEKLAKEKAQKEEFSNPTAILKMRLGKWISTNKEKKKLLDQYMKNVRIIEDAFEQIKEATGIASINEIVTTFIKSEEQNYSLYNYVNMLNADCDTLEESNKEIHHEIRKYEMSGEMSDQKLQQTIKEMKEETDAIRQSIEHHEVSRHQMQDDITKIQSAVEKMSTLFKQSNFFVSVAQKVNYEEGTVFNEQNVVQFLAELEEYINGLITYVAYKNDNPNAAVSAIPLDKLNIKDFQGKPILIDAPGSADIEISQTPEDEENILIDRKDLYKKFQQMVDNNQIQFNPQKEGKAKGEHDKSTSVLH